MTTLDDKLRDIVTEENRKYAGFTIAPAIYYGAALEAMRRAYALGRASVYEANASRTFIDREAIYKEARRRFLDYQRNPPATDEMFDYDHFAVEVAFEYGLRATPEITDALRHAREYIDMVRKNHWPDAIPAANIIYEIDAALSHREKGE